MKDKRRVKGGGTGEAQHSVGMDQASTKEEGGNKHKMDAMDALNKIATKTKVHKKSVLQKALPLGVKHKTSGWHND